MWEVLIKDRLVIPLAAMSILTTLAITPLVFIYAQKSREDLNQDRYYEIKEYLVSNNYNAQKRLENLEFRVKHLEEQSQSDLAKISTITDSLNQAINLLNSSREKK